MTNVEAWRVPVEDAGALLARVSRGVEYAKSLPPKRQSTSKEN